MNCRIMTLDETRGASEMQDKNNYDESTWGPREVIGALLHHWTSGHDPCAYPWCVSKARELFADLDESTERAAEASIELAEAELRSMLSIELVSRCTNAAVEWHELVYLRDKGARQSLMAAVNSAGRQGLENVMLKEHAFASYIAFASRPAPPDVKE